MDASSPPGSFSVVERTSSNNSLALGRTSSASIRSLTEHESSASSSFGGSQSLASILNNPHVGKSGVYGSDASWVGWWSSSSGGGPPELAPLTLNKAVSFTEVNRSDFQRYLASILESYAKFEDIRHHATKENSDSVETSLASLNSFSITGAGEGEVARGQGEALVACLREVPSLYFKEDFALEDGGTFRAACPFSTLSENVVLQEKLSQYLDVVELHLVKEIALRSDSFFEAQGQLQDLNVKIVEACGRIRELKETIRLLDLDLVDSARQIQGLNVTRGNLLALQRKLRLILNVNQALSALKLLVAAADCAGALDVIDDLQNLLDGDELTGLHCFRHLRDQLATSLDSINSILSAEFMRASMHDTKDVDWLILSEVKAKASNLTNGKDEEVKLDEEETANFHDRLLPLIIGLLRTAKLPAVLRLYRDTLIADMKTAIKTTVAELLPVLILRPMDTDLITGERAMDTDGGGSSLASKLRNLSSESFIQLLDAIFKVVQAHLLRAAEVKKAIEWIMSNLDDYFAAESVAAAVARGAAAAEIAQDTDGLLSSPVPYSLQRTASKVSFQGKSNDASSPSNMSRNFRADVLRENTEAVFAACDAAHGRWAKLLGVRALLHPKLRLLEFLSIYNITQDFISATEKIGGRLGYSIRGTLQSQSKAFVDFQHDSRMAKIKAVLDQETWVAVDVPDEFQAIVDSLLCSESLINGSQLDTPGNMAASYIEQISKISGPLLVDGGGSYTQQHVEQPDSVETSVDDSGQIKSTSLAGGHQGSRTDVSVLSTRNEDGNMKEQGKYTSQTLVYKGLGYHMVNCGLILLKMLSEYIDMNNCLPALSPEVVHRVVELLKFFNTRTCQLVLGAGAMQVSGLKSITSKHLALASQVISFTCAIIPEIRRVLFLKIPESRKALLLSEIDRVAKDYKVHRDEIHTKLVQIMRERLLVHLRDLRRIVESWNRPEDNDVQPSQFAKSLTKEVGFLQRVLSRTLHEADVQAIFRQVVQIFHYQISEAFSQLEITTPQAKKRLLRDIQHILGCIRSLPSDNISTDGVPNSGELDEFLAQMFGPEAG
ncbi:vacuolar protein sorting-associated protein 54, chloroplastic [Telopea speciosissima]|uniref:vacuolar protein sorting-associated protein 54, chloroplastic n=1 Tax=Telopea speciosissima TaxID=54955 RepID=UPI001CC54FFD|nr:vacuolar protein sorting-associated protein 54, chloroplastic [Telopea speciosissima]XP_043695604.1 vacuolar protein sorting-associated protein 54, chloroplastic [Telopea speciosissima]